MKIKTLLRRFFCYATVILLIGLFYSFEYVRGFDHFLDPVLAFLVVLGTFFTTGIVYPLRDIFRALRLGLSGDDALHAGEAARARDLLLFAANCAVGIGIIASIIGLGYNAIERDDPYVNLWRLIMTMSSAFFGLFLSETALVPLARRIRDTDAAGSESSWGPDQTSRRHFLGLFSFGLALFGNLLVLCISAIPDPAPYGMEYVLKPIKAADEYRIAIRQSFSFAYKDAAAKKVFLQGSFADGEKIEMYKQGGQWEIHLQLPVGAPVLYHYIVDGKRTLDASKPTVKENHIDNTKLIKRDFSGGCL